MGSVEIGNEANFIHTTRDLFDVRTITVKGLWLKGELIIVPSCKRNYSKNMVKSILNDLNKTHLKLSYC